MALQASKKEKITHFIYSFFAGIVILGALCKITHKSFFNGFLDGNTLLTIGLVAEALVFFYSAIFDQPSGDYEWEKAYPELLDGSSSKTMKQSTSVSHGDPLTQQFEKLLTDARLDRDVFERLRSSLDKFGLAVNEINKTTESAVSTLKYNEEISKATQNMGTLNALYLQQIEGSNKQVELNKQFIDEMKASSGQSERFLGEMKSLSENINALNKVYGGMLSAMKSN